MPIKKISIIIPVFNESDNIDKQLVFLSSFKNEKTIEIIFSDGGSQDDTIRKIKKYGFTVINSAKGRAVQMNAAAQSANGDLLLFLHCDTELPDNFYDSLRLSHKIPPRRYLNLFSSFLLNQYFFVEFVSKTHPQPESASIQTLVPVNPV